MKTLTCIIVALTSVGILRAEPRPNLDRPALTARDLAELLDIRFVKGRLLNREGFRIEAYELFFRDSNGVLQPLASPSAPTPYKHYESKEDDVGELTVALRDEKDSYEITVVVRNHASSQKARYQLKKSEEYVMSCSQEFRGMSGETVDDLTNVVPIGDHDVFTFHKRGEAKEAKPAALVLRTYAKK